MNSRLRTKTAEQRRKNKKTSVKQMAWDFWILSWVHLHLKRLISVCPCPRLSKVPFCNSSEDKFSDAVTPNMALLSVPSHSKQMSEIHSTPAPLALPHREPRLGDMRSGFTRPWAFLCFNFGLRSIHFKPCPEIQILLRFAAWHE